MRNRDISCAALLLLAAVSAPAHAYLDPGSGSAILSAIIGFFVAVSLAVKTYWYKIKMFFNRSETKTSAEDATHEAPPAQANKPPAPAEER